MNSSARPVRELGPWGDLTPQARMALMRRGSVSVFDDDLRAHMERMVDSVRCDGDAAVIAATRQFDGCDLSDAGLRVPRDDIAAARHALSPEVMDAVRHAIARVREFNVAVLSRHQSWATDDRYGGVIGERVSAVASAGLSVPGGVASYPSVAVQLGTAATVAGVERVAIAVPPSPAEPGAVSSAVLAVAHLLGIEDVFRMNGPAGVAALAFGTETVPKMWKVVGPGGPAVACAQLEVQRHGCVTGALTGASESVILADGSADPTLLAADLINEAEHGPDSTSILVTDCSTVLREVQARVAEQLSALPEPRRSFAQAALSRNGGAVVVSDMLEGAGVVNELAPEHLQIVTQRNDDLVGRIVHAGELLIGQDSPFSAANFAIGIPSVLPTGGYAAASSGVTAATFLKRTAFSQLNRKGLSAINSTVQVLADYEGFPAHAAALRRRFPDEA